MTPGWPDRILIGRIALEGVAGHDADIPFTELPRLGGAGLLRGYLTDQFRDRLAAIGTLEYHYPIHANLSGVLFVETGKVAEDYTALLGSGFRNFWHFGYGTGVLVHTDKSALFRIDVAYGDGFEVYFSTDLLNAFRNREGVL